MKSIFTKDLPNKKMKVTREFSAPLDLTWKAWTDKDILDQWWAPKPWKAETKTLNFKEGGHWLYAMVGPAGERHWARTDFKEIRPLKYFIGTDCFCDENGKKNPDMPSTSWHVAFEKSSGGTKVVVDISFPSEKDLQGTIEMGFQEGFTAAHGNLDELFAKMLVK